MTGFQIDIDLGAAAALAEAWQAAPEMVLDELETAATEATLLLEREVKDITPVGVGGGGGLKGSISAREPQVLADAVIGVVGTSIAHAQPVELGTRPHFPPVAPLADWAVAKLGVPRRDARRVGFAIARKISIEGTEGAFMFTRAFEANRGQVAAIYNRANLRIAERLASFSGNGAGGGAVN